METAELYLPALTGQFGQWRYYQVTVTIAEVVRNFGTINAPNHRIKTVEEVSEIYSQRGVSRLLQRAYDGKRLMPITNYLLMQPDKYINNLTVAIFGGSPDWLALDISHTAAGMPVSERDLEFLGDTLGVIKLTGAETLFVLDGQHRLKGLRAAYEEDKSIGDEVVSITMIIHEDSDEGRERTRRLFSTINRHAKPVSKGENILLDEDDVSAIVTRRLIEEYPRFKNREVVALNKSANLYVNQYETKFTSVLTLYAINELLLNNEQIYRQAYEEFGQEYKKDKPKIRPDADTIQSATDEIYKFWDSFFELFPEAVEFLKGDSAIGLERKDGGPFYLRPVGQEAIAMIYKEFDGDTGKFSKLSEIPATITDPFWRHVMWDGSNVLQAKSHVRDYLLYQFGVMQDEKSIGTLRTRYLKYSGETDVELPVPLYLVRT